MLPACDPRSQRVDEHVVFGHEAGDLRGAVAIHGIYEWVDIAIDTVSIIQTEPGFPFDPNRLC